MKCEVQIGLEVFWGDENKLDGSLAEEVAGRLFFPDQSKILFQEWQFPDQGQLAEIRRTWNFRTSELYLGWKILSSVHWESSRVFPNIFAF